MSENCFLNREMWQLRVEYAHNIPTTEPFHYEFCTFFLQRAEMKLTEQWLPLTSQVFCYLVPFTYPRLEGTCRHSIVAWTCVKYELCFKEFETLYHASRQYVTPVPNYSRTWTMIKRFSYLIHFKQQILILLDRQTKPYSQNNWSLATCG